MAAETQTRPTPITQPIAQTRGRSRQQRLSNWLAYVTMVLQYAMSYQHDANEELQ